MKKFGIIACAIGSMAIASGAYANHSWGGYHWARTANPLTLKIGNNVSSVWSGVLASAVSDWSISSVLDAAVVAGQSNVKNCKPTAGRVEVCNSKYGKTGWLGIAQVWANGDHITQGTVKLNDTYFATAQYNAPAWKQFVACQEIGHTFGLDHQDEAFDNPNLGTCMDYTSDPARNDGAGNNLHPNAHDYEELATIYAHLDAVGAFTGAGAANAAQGDDVSGSSEWGAPVRRGNDGKSSVHMRDLGKGQKLFTFVIWAD